MFRLIGKTLKYLLGAAILVIVAFFIGALPIGGKSTAAENGDTIRIYVLSNGFHSDIAIPRNDGLSLRKIGIDETDFPVEHDQVKYWAVGWGSITAYTSLMAVSDLTVEIAAKALAFDEAVMHITPLGALQPGDRVFAIDLAPQTYAALLSSLKTWFASHAPMEVTQGFGDRFYEGNGRFTPWYTCNTWTGRRLREIGIPVGNWTPASQSLEFGLNQLNPA